MGDAEIISNGGEKLENGESFDLDASVGDGGPDDISPDIVAFAGDPEPPLPPPQNPGAESVSQNFLSIINGHTPSVPPQIEAPNAPPIQKNVTMTPDTRSTSTSTMTEETWQLEWL